jgi:hypothetical protein
MAATPKKPEDEGIVSVARMMSSFMLIKNPKKHEAKKKLAQQMEEEQKQNVNPEKEKAPSNPDPTDTKPGMTPTT